MLKISCKAVGAGRHRTEAHASNTPSRRKKRPNASCPRRRAFSNGSNDHIQGSNVQRDRVRKSGAGITFGTLETQRPMARSMPMSEMVVPSACISCDAYLRARVPAG
jgi:hypothetical protein